MNSLHRAFSCFSKEKANVFKTIIVQILTFHIKVKFLQLGYKETYWNIYNKVEYGGSKSAEFYIEQYEIYRYIIVWKRIEKTTITGCYLSKNKFISGNTVNFHW